MHILYETQDCLSLELDKRALQSNQLVSDYATVYTNVQGAAMNGLCDLLWVLAVLVIMNNSHINLI